MLTSKASRRGASLLISLFVISVLMPASVAFAATTCTFDTDWLLITVETDDAVVYVGLDGTVVEVWLNGDQLSCTNVTDNDDELGPDNPGPIEPTLDQTDAIDVVIAGEGADDVGSDNQTVQLDLAEGLLPELYISLGDSGDNWDSVELYGSGGADSLAVGGTNTPETGFDFNGDEIEDSRSYGEEQVWLDGGAGADDLSGSGFNLNGLDEVIPYGGELALDGGSGEDSLRGGSGTNVLMGGSGMDQLSAGPGPDEMDGGAEEDTVRYNDSPAGVTVNLELLSASGGWAEGDTYPTNSGGFSTIEKVNGSWTASNNLTGDALFNSLQGGQMADVLNGGLGDDFLTGLDGADSLDGGPGTDGIWYMDSPHGVTIDLSDGVFMDGYGTDDLGTQDLIAVDVDDEYTIEDVRGSGCDPQSCVDDPGAADDPDKDDVLIGDDRPNRMEAMGGPDYVDGRGGADIVNGADGNDTVYGGDGNDHIVQNEIRDGMDDIYGDDPEGDLTGDGAQDDVDYSGRSIEVEVTTDDEPNDGEVSQDETDLGEQDNVHADVEEVWLPNLPWPECDIDTTTQCILDFDFTNTEGWDTTTTSDDALSEDIDKLEVQASLETYEDDFAHRAWLDLNVVYNSGNISDTFNDRDLIADIAPLTLESVVTVKLAMGDISPIMVFSTGEIAQLDGVSQVLFDEDGVHGRTVELKLTPRPLAFLEPTEEQPCDIGDCGDDTTNARRGFEGAIGAQVISLEAAPELTGDERTDYESYIASVTGSWVTTNAQAWTSPYVEDGAFRFQLAAPHNDMGGIEYPGFFSAFLPEPLLLSSEFGMTSEEVANMSGSAFEVDVTKNSVSETMTPLTEAAESGSTSGVRITLDDFTYSSPEMAIREATEVAPPATNPGSTSPPSSGGDTTPPVEEEPAPEPPQEEVEAPSEGGTIEEDNAIISVPDDGEPIEVIGDDNTILVGGDTETTVDGDDNTVIVDAEEATIDLEGDSNHIDSTDAGDVTLTVDGDANTVEMGSGQDELSLDGEGNTADLGAGADSADVSGSDNTVDMGEGADDLALDGDGNSADMGTGPDDAVVTGTDNTVDMGAGQDDAIVSGSDNTVDMGEGDDTLTLSGTGNTADLGAGDDVSNIADNPPPPDGLRLMAVEEGNTVTGGGGDDRLTSHSGSDVLSGEAGDDVLQGGGGVDALRGNDGVDIVTGGSGNDRLAGGAGADHVNGSTGDDAVFGGAGSDDLEGGRGVDRIYGGAGKDRLDGDRNDSVIDGGTGQDTLI